MNNQPSRPAKLLKHAHGRAALAKEHQAEITRLNALGPPTMNAEHVLRWRRQQIDIHQGFIDMTRAAETQYMKNSPKDHSHV